MSIEVEFWFGGEPIAVARCPFMPVPGMTVVLEFRSRARTFVVGPVETITAVFKEGAPNPDRGKPVRFLERGVRVELRGEILPLPS